MSSTSADPNFDFNGQNYQIFYTICVSSSFAGFFFCVVTILALRAYRSPPAQMVLLISVADLIYSLPYSHVFTNLPDICKYIDFFREYALVSSFLWACCFAHSLKTLFMNCNVIALMENMRSYIAFAQITPLFWAIIPLIMKNEVYDPKRGFCYHEVAQGLDTSYFFSVTLPATLCFMYCMWCYIWIIRQIKEVLQQSQEDSSFLTLLLYPLIFVICWGPTIVTHVMYEMNALTNIAVFYWLLTFTKSQGFFNALIYGVSQNAIQRMRNQCCRQRQNVTVSEELPQQLDLSEQWDRLNQTLIQEKDRPLQPIPQKKRAATCIETV